MESKRLLYKMGGGFDEVGRLRSEQTVQKFVYKFLDDKRLYACLNVYG